LAARDGVYRVDSQMLAFHCLTHFVHELRIVQCVIRIHDQRVAGVEQAMFGKIDHVLTLS
jgi:hypothetical protein